MKKLIVVLSFAVVCPIAAMRAQILPPNEAGVSMGHRHTIVRDVEATKKFWMLLGGTPIKIDGTDVMKFPGILVFLTPGSPSGGSREEVINHVGFTMLNGEEFLTNLKAAGVNVPPNPRNRRFGTIMGPESAWVSTPDGLRISMKGAEFDLARRPLLGFSSNDRSIRVASEYIKSSSPESALPEVQAWYVKVLGGKPVRVPNLGKNYAVDWPGGELMLGGVSDTAVPTKGRALDHIGFEVKNLEAYSKKLVAMGVKFDQPYSKSRHASFASAELTDPWGTSIELTEGLNKF